ncbi:MAG: FISUMP domain-containing protein [Bacteroidota bacterium]|nr:FISUMP domain-containing protein [Bacteroidota bacterium]
MKKTGLIIGLVLVFGILSAQDYKVGFIASGLTTEIDSVEIHNLNQDKDITVYSEDTLHLLDVLSSMPEFQMEPEFAVFPNPSQGTSYLEFYSPQDGDAMLVISDIAGRQIIRNILNLRRGLNKWSVSGFASGTYLIHLDFDKAQYTQKLQVQSSGNNLLKIEPLGLVSDVKMNKSTKNFQLIEWQYDEGDILLFKAWSYGRSRIAVYYINSDNNITFEFINCQDAEGHQYTVTTIGSVTWMAENLKTTRYINNIPLPRIQDETEWNATTEGAFCYSNNDSLSFAADYGPLYNFEAVNSGTLCPNGWHVPSNEKFNNLMIYLQNNGYNYDGSSDSDADPDTNNLISKALSADYSFNPSANSGVPGNNDYPEYMNRSGFSALAAGHRIETNNFDNSVNCIGDYWTSTTNRTSYNKFMVSYQVASVGIFYTFYNDGCSVRCVKD